MPDWIDWLFERGLLGGFAAAVVWVIWWKVLPWCERYVASKEKLDERLALAIEKNGDQCEVHGEGIIATAKHLKRHDNVIRTACAACREVAALHDQQTSTVVNRHCAEIERIIGEA
jgi:hypothetical protein